MKYVIDVKYSDGRTVRAETTAADVIHFERQYPGVTFQSLYGDGVKLEYWCYLAWAALHRTGQEPGTFDAFLELLDEIDLILNEPELPDPTQPDPSPEPSSE